MDHVVAPEHPELRRAAGRLLARGTAHHLGHPLRPLDVGDRRLVVAGRPDAVDDLAERAQRHGGLAEGGQHPLDVAHEDPAGADHQHAAALVAAAVGVEQVRRAVQRDHGLAGAGAAGDRDDALAGRADRLVLLGLDGRDDGVHRPVAGPRELRHQRALADDRQVGLDGVGSSSSSSTPSTCAPLQRSTRRRTTSWGVGGGGLVEHRGRRRPPVDQQRLAVGVAQPDPADVARLRVALGAQVEPAEDQPLVGGVELGDAARGLEDHRVALDEATLVLEPAAVVALAGQRLRRLGGVAQLDVDAVDEGLLVGDLALGEVITHCGSPDFVRACFPVGLIWQTVKPTRRPAATRRNPPDSVDAPVERQDRLLDGGLVALHVEAHLLSRLDLHRTAAARARTADPGLVVRGPVDAHGVRRPAARHHPVGHHVVAGRRDGEPRQLGPGARHGALQAPHLPGVLDHPGEVVAGHRPRVVGQGVRRQAAGGGRPARRRRRADRDGPPRSAARRRAATARATRGRGCRRGRRRPRRTRCPSSGSPRRPTSPTRTW